MSGNQADKFKQSSINFAAISTGISFAGKTVNKLQVFIKNPTGTYTAQIEAEAKLALAI